ncbi:HER046Wp [Eremothecium sinecaudum]|uniref:HER046Wp n=1 Tax=Eremothecium sinecaudum TaxID=45286 RepID=A0A0X8HTR7_9SACH|nr:HER046Wp [Eremothecium sinecaudum]AMD21325.1 HER046Wp [Eremothecium sinecaudum]
MLGVRDENGTNTIERPRKHSRSQMGVIESSQANEEEDEEGDEELLEEWEDDEGETRCICGDMDPPDVSGLYIQCEECAVWQHGYCVGIGEGDNTPDKYWCEQCKPELHSVYKNESNQKRSYYKPVNQRRRQNRRAKRSSERSTEQPMMDPEDEVFVKHERKSEEEDDKNLRTRDSAKSERSTASLEENSHNNVSSPNGNEEEEKRLLNRKRATLSAREEKQYQLMLEKAIQESRRTSQPEESLRVDDENELSDKGLSGSDSSPPTATSTTSVGTAAMPPTSKQESNKGSTVEDSATNKQSPSPAPSSTTRKRTRGKSANSNSSSEDDGSRKKSRRGGTRNSSSATGDASPPGARGNSSTSEITANSDISINKPIKPRLPTQRTSLSEMQRRINAILEFLSRTQVEFSQDERGKNHLVQFVENDAFMTKINDIFKDYDRSLKMMDSLTRKLLLWEQKYSSNRSAT